MQESLPVLVSRFTSLKQNGAEAHGKCLWCATEADDTLKVSDTAWRTICCCEQEVNGNDATGFYMSFAGVSRENAQAALSNGPLPEPAPVQAAPLRQLPFWGWRWLDKLPQARVWVHWNAEGVHLGRKHFPDRIHLGTISGRSLDDLSILPASAVRGPSGRAGEYCVLLPVNTEASREYMDKLAYLLYRNGHKKVQWIDFSRRKIK